MRHNTVSILGFDVFSDFLAKIPVENCNPKTILTISPNSYGIALKDISFKEALKNADYLVLDGVYFALASIFLLGKNIKRNQGPDVFFQFMLRINDVGGKVFFLGSTERTLEMIKKRASIDHPNIKVETYSPPFKGEFEYADNKIIFEKINEFKPDIVFVGMTCPKQEKWAIENKSNINTGLIICIGNVFDWYAGTQKRIHPIWFKLRVGWLVRIFLRPEIFQRNIGNQMRFFADVFLMFLRLKPQIK